MKTTIIKITILTLALCGLSCKSAVPYVPPPIIIGTDLDWNLPPPGVTATIIHRSTDTLTWQTVAVIPAPQTNAPGILTNVPGTAAYCATFTNAATLTEGQPSVQITNTFNAAPPVPSGFQTK